ncbi:MAG: hypothetical protein M1475_06230 [Actinobacteria bacterium]|nr:hypothetical protein [Actinomycetota bacterium]
MAQLHKNFTEHQVKELIYRYMAKEIERSYIQEILRIKKTRFFALVKKYRKDPESFSIEYKRKKASRKISKDIEDSIMKELKIEKRLIADPEVPLRSYNYSYIKDRLLSGYDQKVSTPTIIDRAKKGGFYLKKPKRKTHDREVLTNYVGELIQHDSSHHRFSPYACSKWYLITSIDDCSRFLLYYKLTERETSWAHIEALEEVALKYGLAYSYYVDCHSIFRFVQGRDSFWRKHYKVTDETDPQVKQVLDDLRVKLIYALSAQAKGKIERPYGWLQDRIVRTCAREGIDNIIDGNKVLEAEAARYNYKQVHSTGEVPYYRLKRLTGEGKSLFRKFVVPAPYTSTKDVFALRDERIVNPYRKISFNKLVINITGVPIRDRVSLRMYCSRSKIRNGRNQVLVQG